MDLSVIIPCYNEHEGLEALGQALEETLSPAACGLDVQIILIDDGSSDGTTKGIDAVAQRLGEKGMSCLSVEFSRNFGKEAALLCGLSEACGDCCGIMDADLQQPPATLLDMYHKLVSSDEYDMVAAYQEHRHENPVVAWLKDRFYGVFARSSHSRIIKGASDFRVFRRNVCDAVLSMSESDRFSKGIFAWVGFPTLAYPYEPDERVAGTSKWSVRKLFSYAFEGILSFTTAPLRFSAALGFIVFVVAVVLGIEVAVEALVTHTTPSGYPTLVCLTLFFGSVQLLSVGLLGEYLGRTYMQAKRRPNFIVRRTKEFGPSTSKTDEAYSADESKSSR